VFAGLKKSDRITRIIVGGAGGAWKNIIWFLAALLDKSHDGRRRVCFVCAVLVLEEEEEEQEEE
jgi:hypothetical protein